MFTIEEKLMYEVMKAIYDSGIPINFKGSMVLKAYMVESGYYDEIRHTIDIDANWNSDISPTGEQMIDSIQHALTQCGIDMDVKLYRMYAQGRSAGFELFKHHTGELLFTMDIDVNRPATQTKIYELAGIRFCGATPSQMLADKIAVVSSDKVFRRIKDVVDLYYFSKVIPFEPKDIIRILTNSGRTLNSFDGFLNRQNDLKHAYDKFRFTGGVNKPEFDDVYQTVKDYIEAILPV